MYSAQVSVEGTVLCKTRLTLWAPEGTLARMRAHVAHKDGLRPEYLAANGAPNLWCIGQVPSLSEIARAHLQQL